MLIFTILVSPSYGNDLTLNCENFDCYAFGSVGGGVGEGTVDHPIRDYYPKEEIEEIIEEYPPLLNFLPIGRKRALKEGIYLPLPIGTAVNSVFLSQSMILENPSVNPPSNLNFEDTKDERFGIGARFGFWLFRFLNIYVAGGGSWGEATTKGNYASTPFEIKVKYHGGQVGVGGTAAIGYKRFFLVVDGNYSWLFLNVSEETNNTYHISPKIGMMLESKEFGNGAFYVGAGYLNYKIVFDGKIPGTGTPFKVNATPKVNWNFIFGGSWEWNPRWSIFAEAGVADRKQFVFGGMFRF